MDMGIPLLLIHRRGFDVISYGVNFRTSVLII